VKTRLGIWRFIGRRVGVTVGVVFTVITLSFLIIKLAPGDPALLLAGAGVNPQYLQAIRAEYGLDLPLWQQFVIYLETALTGNLGFSITYTQPVLTVILSRLFPTLILVIAGGIFSIGLGILLGLVSASKPNSITDEVISFSTSTLYAIPVFWLGLIMIFTFSIQLRLFPTGGMTSLIVSSDPLSTAVDVGWHAVLPVVTIGVVFLAFYASMTRAGLLEALSANFTTYARAKGASERRILYRHAFRNSLLPIISLAGTQISLMIGALVLVENIFSWPGLGTLIVQAFLHRDYPLTTGLLVFSAIAVAFSNLAADILYAIVDPRVRRTVET
jgi:peptide/nickel transport system permease protein